MTDIENAIAKLDHCLRGQPFDFAFLGGAVLSLLVTDPIADTVRVTKDIDVMMNIRTRKEYHKADSLLEELGFKHDIREGAPICRWIYDDVTVDVLPANEDVLGWKSKWFADALTEANAMVCGDHTVKVISGPFFVALKLEAFEDRGQSDFLASTDFEDVICLFNGRESIVDEIRECEKLRPVLAAKFGTYIQSADMEDAVGGFVQTEDNPTQRKFAILKKFKAVSELA